MVLYPHWNTHRAISLPKHWWPPIPAITLTVLYPCRNTYGAVNLIRHQIFSGWSQILFEAALGNFDQSQVINADQLSCFLTQSCDEHCVPQNSHKPHASQQSVVNSQLKTRNGSFISVSPFRPGWKQLMSYHWNSNLLPHLNTVTVKHKFGCGNCTMAIFTLYTSKEHQSPVHHNLCQYGCFRVLGIGHRSSWVVATAQ